MKRREDFSEVNKWIHQPRAKGKYNKKTQMFFKVQTQPIVRELSEREKNHSTKRHLGLTTKIINPLRTQKMDAFPGKT